MDNTHFNMGDDISHQKNKPTETREAVDEATDKADEIPLRPPEDEGKGKVVKEDENPVFDPESDNIFPPLPVIFDTLYDEGSISQTDGNIKVRPHKQILVINPNSSRDMTYDMREDHSGDVSHGLPTLYRDRILYRSRSADSEIAILGKTSINDEDDAAESARIVMNHLKDVFDRITPHVLEVPKEDSRNDTEQDPKESSRIQAPPPPGSSRKPMSESARNTYYERFDGFLVACYSVHPLVGKLREYIKSRGDRKPVVGIFEASVSTALTFLPMSSKGTFGIVTTGLVWEDILTTGVEEYLGGKSNRFAGVKSCGVNAGDLHTKEQEGNISEVAKQLDTPPDPGPGALEMGDTKNRMSVATQKLLESNNAANVQVICLGCAGMAGMDPVIIKAAKDVGVDNIRVIDGVKAGLLYWKGLIDMYH